MLLSLLFSTINLIVEILIPRSYFFIFILIVLALGMVYTGYFVLRAAWFNGPQTALRENAIFLWCSALVFGVCSFACFVSVAFERNWGKV
jgi:hypothetical protein